MDLQLTIQKEMVNKPLRSRWVPSHADIAKTKEERMEIKRNDEGDRLAKKLPPAYRSLATHLLTRVISPSRGGLHPSRQKNESSRGDTMTYFWVHTGYLGSPSKKPVG